MRGILLTLALGTACCIAEPVPAPANPPSATAAPVKLVPAVSAPVKEEAKSGDLEKEIETLAKTDPERGIFRLDETGGYHPPTPQGDRNLKVFAAELVKADPGKAIELYDRFEPGHNRSMYAIEVASALKPKDLADAWDAYKSQRGDPAKRANAARIIGIHCCRSVEGAWNAYLAHEPEPDKKLFLGNICISPGGRSTADTTFSLNMMRTVQSCAKCEAAFEVFASNQDGKDLQLMSSYLAAHPKKEKLDPAYADLATDRLKDKDPYEAAKWMSRMTCHRDDLLAQLKDGLKSAPPKTQKAITALVPEVASTGNAQDPTTGGH